METKFFVPEKTKTAISELTKESKDPNVIKPTVNSEIVKEKKRNKENPKERTTAKYKYYL